MFVHTTAESWAKAAPGPNPKESERQETPTLPWDPSTPSSKLFPCIPRGSVLENEAAMLIKQGFHKFSLFFCSCCKGITHPTSPKGATSIPSRRLMQPSQHRVVTPAGLIN